MATLTPILTGTPGQPPTYNVGMAETFSWVPVQNDVSRPLFAKAVYNVNAPNQNGFVITTNTSTITGDFNSIRTITSTKFSGITADNCSIPTLNFDFPANFLIEGHIQSYVLLSGSVIAYRN